MRVVSAHCYLRSRRSPCLPPDRRPPAASPHDRVAGSASRRARAAVGRTASAYAGFGLADYGPRTFSDPRVAEFGVRYCARRGVVERGTCAAPLAQVRAWLEAVRAHGITPLITFRRAIGNRRAPTPASLSCARFCASASCFHRCTSSRRGTRPPTPRSPPSTGQGLVAEFCDDAAKCRGSRSPRPTSSTPTVTSSGERPVRRAPRPYPRIWPFNPCHSASVDGPPLVERPSPPHARAGVVRRGRRRGVVAPERQADRPRRAIRGAGRHEYLLAGAPQPADHAYLLLRWRSPGSPRRARKATWDAGLVSASGAARPGAVGGHQRTARHVQHWIPKVY